MARSKAQPKAKEEEIGQVVTVGDCLPDNNPMRVQLAADIYCLVDDGLVAFFVPSGVKGTVVGLDEHPELSGAVTVLWDTAFAVDRRQVEPGTTQCPVQRSVKGWRDTSVRPETLIYVVDH